MLRQLIVRSANEARLSSSRYHSQILMVVVIIKCLCKIRQFVDKLSDSPKHCWLS